MRAFIGGTPYQLLHHTFLLLWLNCTQCVVQAGTSLVFTSFAPHKGICMPVYPCPYHQISPQGPLADLCAIHHAPSPDPGGPGLLGHAAAVATRLLSSRAHGGSARHGQAFVELLVERGLLGDRRAWGPTHAVLEAFGREGDLHGVSGQGKSKR